MAKSYIPVHVGFGPLVGDGGPTSETTADNQAGFGGVGAPNNRTITQLIIFRGTAADGATAACRIPFDCEPLALEGSCTSGTTPTFTLSDPGPFTSSARALDGTLQTNLTTLEKQVLKAGTLLTATLNNGGGNTVDAIIRVWVQVIGQAPNP